MHRARCLVALKCGRQHPKTARPGQIFRQGDGHLSVLFQSKSLVKKRRKKEKKYCTVEIPTEMEFTGTFQKYLQCANVA